MENAEVFIENMENNVGKNIAALRRARGLTQAELAGQLHFTYQAVSNWERGVSVPDADTLLRLSAFFGVSADALLRGQVKPPAPARSARRGFRFSPKAARAGVSAESEARIEDAVSAAPLPACADAAAEGGARAKRAAGSASSLAFTGPVGAVGALRGALIAYTACIAVSAIVSLFGNETAVILLYIPALLIALLSGAAAVVLFFFAKVPASAAAVILFAAGLIGSEGCALATLFLSEEGTAYFAVSCCGGALALLSLYAAPFAFARKEEEEGVVKTYFFLISVRAVCLVLTLLLPGSGLAVLLSFVDTGMELAALWCLFAATEDRQYGQRYPLFKKKGRGRAET